MQCRLCLSWVSERKVEGRLFEHIEEREKKARAGSIESAGKRMLEQVIRLQSEVQDWVNVCVINRKF